MKIIVGLGNPGEKYKKNRHNVGFMFVEYLLESYNLELGTSNPQLQNSSYKLQAASFKYNKYLLSETAKLQVSSFKFQEEIILAKPQTYMNKSGMAVKKLLEKYPANHQSLATSHLIIVHDDLDIPFGKFKIQMQGPKSHNGVTDIQNKLASMDFLRVRIGVDNRPVDNRMQGEEYVLEDFTSEETAQLPELFAKIKTRFEPFLQSKNDCT